MTTAVILKRFVLGLLLSSALVYGMSQRKGQDQSMAQKSKTSRGLYLVANAPHVLPETEVASFGAGCFWGVEQGFRKTPGVIATAVGFMGESKKNPTYEQVCYENTGHAEVVQLEFDPQKISYSELLDLFWHLHDPTTANRQGPDVGTQYRSAVFFHTTEQQKLARQTQSQLQASGELNAPIVTEITPAGEFFPAEAYHQQYVEKGGRAGCHIRRRIGAK